ncbi:MAG TPA: hypothetical protein VGR71_13760, partial [Nitrospira sp.]|nr:hypothetical protein [Nitrospira sp.]
LPAASVDADDSSTASKDTDDDDCDDDCIQSETITAPGDANRPAARASNQRNRGVDEEDDDDEDADVPTAPAYIMAAPGVDTRFSYYGDTEGNLTLTSTSRATSMLDDVLVQLRQDAIWARDAFGTQRVESRTVSAYQNLSEQFGIGGSFGFVRAERWSAFAGSLMATENIGDATVALNVTRGLVGGTAQAIRDHVMQTDFGLAFSNDFTSNLSAELNFHHKLYSDGNNSDDFLFSPQYEFALGQSKLALGYGVAYQSFATSDDHGYYAPRRLLSNGLTGTWKFDRNNYYGNVETWAGYSNIKGASAVTGATGSGMNGSVLATWGLRPGKATLVESFWSSEWCPGWSSTSLGLRVQYTF